MSSGAGSINQHLPEWMWHLPELQHLLLPTRDIHITHAFAPQHLISCDLTSATTACYCSIKPTWLTNPVSASLLQVYVFGYVNTSVTLLHLQCNTSVYLLHMLSMCSLLLSITIILTFAHVSFYWGKKRGKLQFWNPAGRLWTAQQFPFIRD